MGHAVHRASATGAKGGDSAGEWATANGLKLEWLTFGVPEVHDRLYREATLAQGSVDLGLVANRYIGPRIATMFEPLDDYLKRRADRGFRRDRARHGRRHDVRGEDLRHPLPPRDLGPALQQDLHGRARHRRAAEDRRGDDRAGPRSSPSSAPTASRCTASSSTAPARCFVVDVARAWNGDFLTPKATSCAYTEKSR